MSQGSDELKMSLFYLIIVNFYSHIIHEMECKYVEGCKFVGPTLQCTFCEYSLYHIVETNYQYIQQIIFFNHLACQLFIAEQLYADVDHSVSYSGSVQGSYQNSWDSTVVLDESSSESFLKGISTFIFLIQMGVWE